jgi:hypothetical protein
MKRIALLLTAVLIIGIAAVPAAEKNKADLAAIKRAVAENPAPETAPAAKWFKVLVIDARTNKEKVKITLPISLVEIFVKSARNSHVRMRRHDVDIDIAELWSELKKIGPMTFIEIAEGDEIVKVWIE